MNYNFNEISEYAIDRIEDILSFFSIDYTRYKNRISCCCPVHEGDNPEGFNILLNGVGNWQCFTNLCHESYGNSKGASILSLVQALKKDSFINSVKWLVSYLNIDTSNHERQQGGPDFFLKTASFFAADDSKDYAFFPISSINKLKEHKYYINRGYSKEILKKFMVGFCDDSKKPMYNRMVVPILDDNGEKIIGFTGRSIHEKCLICDYYHNQKDRCPQTKMDKMLHVKWRNSKGLSGDILYNYWNAKKYIEKTRSVAIVEGAGDVWKLDSARIYNSVGLLRANITDKQLIKLEQSGALNLFLITDNDNAGLISRKVIREKCEKMFNVIDIFIPDKYKDIGSIICIDELNRLNLKERICPIY